MFVLNDLVRHRFVTQISGKMCVCPGFRDVIYSLCSRERELFTVCSCELVNNLSRSRKHTMNVNGKKFTVCSRPKAHCSLEKLMCGSL